MDLRLDQLKNWVSEVLQCGKIDVTPASSDASFRRYIRVKYDNHTMIVMDAPVDKEDSHPFVQIASWLSEMGIHAPVVKKENFQEGFFLLSDLGQTQYLDVLETANVDKLYKAAINSLVIMQAKGHKYVTRLPEYDQQLFLAEMSLFYDWYLIKHLGIELTRQQEKVLHDTFNLLIDTALQQPRVFVHRDYHSRNLMYLEGSEENPGVLDFQDAVFGPVSYDLVSLLRDCYIKWPDERVKEWKHYYIEKAQSAGILSEPDCAVFKTWFDLMGVQRHLKAIGIFSRLNYRDNKPGYLEDIPRTMGYVFDVCSRYDELAAFRNVLIELGLPPDHVGDKRVSI